MITALFQLLDLLIRLYVWALILSAVFSMLSAFGVLDTRNRLVWTVGPTAAASSTAFWRWRPTTGSR